jgi:hypothetical protein
MVNTVNYPSCCGGAILTGFTGADEAVRQSMLEQLATLPKGRIVNFVLNQGQVDRLPLTLAAADNAGFVLAAVFINDVHGSTLYEFQRCGKRRNINEAARRIGWRGQIINPAMQGDLRDFDYDLGAAAQNQGVRDYRNIRGYMNQAGNIIDIDMQVRIDSPRSRWHGRIVRITRISRRQQAFGYGYYVGHFYARGNTHQISINNMVPVVDAAADAAPAAPPRIHLYNEPARHVLGEGGGGAVEPVIVYTSFHNRYRYGRIGAGYENAEAARQAAPHCQTQIRRDVYSNGDIQQNEVI